MRLIDQIGCCDIPYEQVVLEIDEGNILARTPDGSKFLMAEYSDIETAQKALKKLWIDYQKSIECKRLSFKPFEYTGLASEYFRFPTEEQLA